MGAYKHNERKTKNHSNKNIDESKTELNYYIKKNELSYIKEFDWIKEKYDLKGQIKSTSNIMCEMVFTSDQKFFDEIGYEEAKRYFNESYKFVCDYKNLGEQNIISAVVHMDEDTPRMHLTFIPVIHTKDKKGNSIDKVCCRDFWKGRDSYRNLQNAYFAFIKPKDNLTNQLHQKNLELHNELSKQAKVIDEAQKHRNERDKMIEDNEKLKITVKVLEKEYKKKSNTLDLKFNNRQDELEKEFEEKTYNLEYQYKNKVCKLEKENNYLHKIINKFYETIDKFIHWICIKFDIAEEDNLIRDFEFENNIYLNPEKQNDYDLEL